MSLSDQIRQIKNRIAYLRDSVSVSPEEIAAYLSISTEAYNEYESGDSDIPISMIYGIAHALGVDATEIMTGEAPRMSSYSVTRKNKGIKVERYKGYDFEALAYNFIDRDKEPMLVTIEPSDERPELVTHSGQEFNYVLEGKVGVIIGAKTIELNAGDSIYFNPMIPHGQIAIGGKVRFLTIIDK